MSKNTWFWLIIWLKTMYFLFRSCYNDGKYEGASMKKNQLNISLVVGFISVSCTASLFLCQDSFADDIVTDVAVDVPAACTIAGEVDTPHTREMEGGTYREDIGTTTFKVICNDNSGFSVYAVGYSNEKIGNNKMLATVSGELAPSFDIVTGTASSGSTSNWAMKLSPVAGTYAPTILSDTNGSFSSYHVVPESYARVATFPNGTDGTNGSAFTSTYATYVTSAQPSGTYSSKVKYTIVHPANEAAPLSPQPSTAGCITYYANVSDAQGTMGTQCSLTDGASITLYASNFSRAGYGFAGWSDAYDYATNPNAKFYGPMEDITVPEGTATNGLSLYAVWVKSTGSLQDTNKVTELCGTTTTNGTLVQAPTNGTANLSSVSALTDQRDNQTYAIAKLADGKCWMIENLRLDNQYTVGNNQTDPTVTNQSLSQGYNPSFTGLADPETSFPNSTIANSLYTTATGVEGKNTISGSNQAQRFPRYNNNNTSQRATNTTNTNVNTYSYGNYYTWAAVIADTTHYTSGDHNTTSICPKGWSIPQGNAGFAKLDIDMGGTGASQSTAEASNRWRKYPTNFLYSGYVGTSSAINRGRYGYYWSSPAANANNSYSLRLYSTYVEPGTGYYNKYLGYTARCVASPST